jgi:hypothetical protein
MIKAIFRAYVFICYVIFVRHISITIAINLIFQDQFYDYFNNIRLLNKRAKLSLTQLHKEEIFLEKNIYSVFSYSLRIELLIDKNLFK